MSLAASPITRPARRLIEGVCYLGAGAAMCVLAFVVPRIVPLGDFDFLSGLVLCTALAAAAALLVGPPQWVLMVFLAYMTASHMHQSPFVLPFGGVNWYPREILLFALLGRFAVRVWNVRARIPLSPMHFCIGAVAVAWFSMAITGLLEGNDRSNWIEESRFAFFMIAYIPFVDLIDSSNRIRKAAWLVFGIAMIAALASISLFIYTLATGDIISNVQNSMGEFVKRQVGPFLLQSIRPNGHAYFEIGITVLVALFFCRATSVRARLGIVAALVLFGFAILITMMRTAYVTTALGLALLALASLPKSARALLVLGGVGTLLLGAVVLGPEIAVTVDQQLPVLEVSLKGRLAEMGGALEVFQSHPLLGGGLGKTFEAMGYVTKATEDSYGQATYLMVHNVWLYYLFKGGLVSFVLALFGLGGIAVYGWRLADRLIDPTQRAFCRGLACAFIAQCVGSIAMPRFNYPTGFVYIALNGAIFVALARERKDDHSAN